MVLFFQTIFAGAVGTCAMTFLMTIIHRSRWANADMIRALGSLASKQYKRALIPGVIIHFAAGILFAFPYAILLTLVAEPQMLPLAGMGLVLGLFHGIVVAFGLVALVSENHPVEMFRKAGPEVAIAHIVGHMGYGCVVGAMIGLMGINYNLV